MIRDANQEPPYSVIIVLHNSADDLESCLLSVPECAEVIVVDNDSTDDGPALVRRALPTATVVERQINDGFGAGCNIGAEHSSSNFLVFLNPDTQLSPGALDTLRQAWQADVKDVVGPALTSSAGELYANCRRRSRLIYDVLELLPASRRWCPAALRRDLPEDDVLYKTGGVVDYLQGACLGVGRNIFFAVGGFDTSFFLYSEEEDLCRRIAAAGGRCRYVPSSVVLHIAQTSSSKVQLFSVYHMFRSKAILYRKWSGCVRANTTIGGLYAFLWCDRALASLRGRLGFRPRRSREWSIHALRGLRRGWSDSLG